MALTPEDIEAHIFKVARRGYDKVEVDRFLGQVATDYRQLQEAAEAPAAAPVYTPVAAAEPGPTLPRREPPRFGSPTGLPGGQLFAMDEPAPEPAVEPLLAPPADPVPAEEPVAPVAAPVAAAATTDGDDFNRLGSEVANVLRTAHHSVATLRGEAEVEAQLIRQRAEREIDELRRSADDYAARVRVEADAYAAERANEAQATRREADRVLAETQARSELTQSDADAALAEARVRADLVIGDAEAKAEAALAAAESAAAARRAEAEAEASALLGEAERRVAALTQQAETNARTQAHAILAEADRRLYDADRQLEAARAAEDALKDKLAAALGQFAAEAETEAARPAPPTIDLTDAPADEPSAPVEATIDLTDDSAVPAGWRGPSPASASPSRGPRRDLFGDRSDRGDRGGSVTTAEHAVEAPTDTQTDALPYATDEDDDPAVAPSPAADGPGRAVPVAGGDEDPLTDIVRTAIGRAVQSAMQRSDEA